MNKKTIKRKKRFFEHLTLDSYTGLIFVSSKLPKINDHNKPLRINLTNLYFYKNKYCLLNHFIPNNQINTYLSTKYKLENKIITIDPIFYKKTKVIYMVYLKSNTKINNFTILKTLNIFKKNDYIDLNYPDLYEAIYKNNKDNKYKKINIYYDNNNYIETTLNTIFYYLIGNNEINKSICI